MKRSTALLPGITFLLLLLPLLSAAQIPREIFYQGVLTDSTGVPKADGSYTFVFTLYPDSTGTTSVWTSGSRSLTVKGGLFYTGLAFPSTVAFDQKYWLGITAGGEVLSPRIPLSSAAYSIASIRSDTAGYALASAQQSYSAGVGLMLTGTTFSIANLGVIGTMVADGAVTSAKIANETINSTDIDTNAVTTSELLDDAVTMAKIDDAGAADGQVLKWTNAGWAPRNDSLGMGTSYSAGSGLALTGSVFSIASGGVTNQKLSDSSLTITPGIGLSGGGDLSLGDSVTISHGPHSGDVAGADRLTVTGLQGRGVDGTLPSDGYVLKWSSTNGRWEPSIDVSGGAGGIGGSGGDNSVARFRGATTLESSAIYDSSGNIGIGTTTPQSKLDVNGTVQMTGFRLGTTSTDGYVLTTDANGVGGWEVLPAGGIGGSGTDNYLPRFSGTTTLQSSAIYDSAGNIGIGTTTPQNQLDVEGEAVIGATYSGTSSAPTNGLLVEGNVGIGTSSPLTRLDVNGKLHVLHSIEEAFLVETSTTAAKIRLNDAGVGDFDFGIDAEGFFVNDRSRAPVKELTLRRSTGFVGINVTDPLALLHLAPDIGDDPIRIDGLDTPTTAIDALGVDPAGVLKRGTQPSNRRFKDNIRPLNPDPISVFQLSPVRFTWKEDGKEDIGLIAEEVDEAVSDLIIRDNQGEPRGVKYDKVALYLLELVRQQEKRIGELEEKVKVLIATKPGSGAKDFGELQRMQGQ